MQKKRSLQRRLWLVYTALVLVLVCLSLFISFSFVRSFKRDIMERNLRLASSIAGQIEVALGHHANELRQLSGEISEKGANSPLVVAQMDRIVRYHPLMERIVILDNNGLVQAAYPEEPDELNMVTSEYIENRTETRKGEYDIIWSNARISHKTGLKTITAATPFDGGRVVAFLNPGVLSETVMSINPFKKGLIALLDRNGNSLTEITGEIRKQGGSFLDTVSVARAMDGLSGSYEEEIGGIRGLSSTRLVRETGWVVLIFQSGRDTFGEVNSLLRFSIMLLLSGMMASMLINLRLLNRIMNPLKILVRQVKSIADGGYNVAIKVGFTEFEEVVDSFDRMARSVEAREDDLRESESRYRELFYNSPIPVIIFDAEDMTILDVSNSAAEDYGFSREEFIGMNISRIRPDEDIEEVPERIRSYPPSMERAGVWQHRKKNGAVIYVDIASHDIVFHGKKAVLAVCRDITGTIQIEDALRDSQEKLRAVLESIGDAIIIIDAHMQVTWANKVATDSIGYIVNEKCHFAVNGGRGHCRNCAAVRSFNEERLYRKEMRIPGPDGRFRDYLVTTAPVYDEWGQVMGVVKSLKDISDMKRSEKLLLSSLAEKEALLKTVHHQVKNNLQAISGIISLQEAYSPDLWTRKVLRDSQDRILSLALIYEKLFNIEERNKIDFGDYVYTLVQRLSKAYMAKERGILVDVTCEFLPLNVDTAVPCGLILTELISNCFKHAFLERTTGKIGIGVKWEDPDRILISVDDDGIGLPGEFDDIYREFLGLNIIRLQIEFLSGRITTSTENGTRYDILVHEYEECSHMNL